MLASYTRFGVGGPADVYAEAASAEVFVEALKQARGAILFGWFLSWANPPAARAADSTGVAEFQVPALTGPVVDGAGILREDTKLAVSNALRALREQGGSQITVLTVASLEGLPIGRLRFAWSINGTWARKKSTRAFCF